MPKHIVALTSLVLLASPVMSADKPVALEPPMVTIPAGELLMGSERAKESQPVHPVAIKTFKMGKYEVTAAEFQRFVQATRHRVSPMCLQLAGKRWMADVPNEYRPGVTLLTTSLFEPATCVGWNDAKAYAKWLAAETGRKFRLPTEAEWEYAHRAGSSQRYFFGNDETQVCRYGNVADRSAEAAVKRDYDGLESRNHVGVMPCDDKAGYASIVGMYEANAFGLHDTIGNIDEFVDDCWHDSYTGAPSDGSAWITGECKTRVLRGSAWHWRPPHASGRVHKAADAVDAMTGFRLAEDLSGPAEPARAPGVFETELAQAQRVERARREKIPDQKPAPR